jgi:hypothetical protein
MNTIQMHLEKNNTITLEAWDDNGIIIDTLTTSCNIEAYSFTQNYDYTRIIN